MRFEDYGAPPFSANITLDNPAYIDPTVRLYGRVSAGKGSSFWPYTVARAEGMEVRLGKYCNVQDHACLHIGNGTPTIIGDYVSITHRAIVHGAKIGNDTLIGIGATIMDGAEIGANCIVAGHTIVSEGKIIPDNSVVAGVPGRVIATRNNFVVTRRNALIYHRNALHYAQGRHDAWEGAAYEAWMADISKRLEAGENVEPDI